MAFTSDHLDSMKRPRDNEATDVEPYSTYKRVISHGPPSCDFICVHGHSVIPKTGADDTEMEV